jgi:signal transduction protein with GAF and PtsI domain
MDKEGVILEPTSLDLVGRCGLLSALSAQGLQQAKLEGVGNFAGNVLILIQAKVPEEEEEERKEKGQRSLRVTLPRQPLLMMSKRLMERRNWAK